jgi:hypothetical protein
VSDPRELLERIADAAPAPGGARREHEVRRAIDAGLAGPAAPPARAWVRWVALGVGLAAAAAIALFWFGARRAGEPAVIVEAGAIAAPRAGQLVEVPADAPAVVRTPDRSRIEAAAATRFVRVDREATRWRLEDGALRAEVSKRAPGETFEIATAEATVAVVGTRFVVERRAARTQVRVEEGVVRVTPVGGAPVMLRAGEMWPAEEVKTARAQVPVPVPVPVPPTIDPIEPSPAPVKPAPAPAKAFDAGAIRRIIRAGKLGDARSMIESGRKATSSARGLAELGILAAEADLAERKTRSAIDKYLAVLRDYPSTPQAEQALFAAAQLAFDRPDAGYKPAALLRDYLDTYPRGVFAKDAQRLLDRAGE